MVLYCTFVSSSHYRNINSTPNSYSTFKSPILTTHRSDLKTIWNLHGMCPERDSIGCLRDGLWDVHVALRMARANHVAFTAVLAICIGAKKYATLMANHSLKRIKIKLKHFYLRVAVKFCLSRNDCKFQEKFLVVYHSDDASQYFVSFDRISWKDLFVRGCQT